MISMLNCFVHLIRCPRLLLLLVLTLGIEPFSCNIIVGSPSIPFCCCYICSPSFLISSRWEIICSNWFSEDFDSFFRSALKCVLPVRHQTSKKNLFIIIIIIIIIVLLLSSSSLLTEKRQRAHISPLAPVYLILNIKVLITYTLKYKKIPTFNIMTDKRRSKVFCYALIWIIFTFLMGFISETICEKCGLDFP